MRSPVASGVFPSQCGSVAQYNADTGQHELPPGCYSELRLGARTRLVLQYRGSHTILVEAPYAGSVFAPAGTLVLGGNHGQVFRGRFYGKLPEEGQRGAGGASCCSCWAGSLSGVVGRGAADRGMWRRRLTTSIPGITSSMTGRRWLRRIAGPLVLGAAHETCRTPEISCPSWAPRGLRGAVVVEIFSDAIGLDNLQETHWLSLAVRESRVRGLESLHTVRRRLDVLGGEIETLDGLENLRRLGTLRVTAPT